MGNDDPPASARGRAGTSVDETSIPSNFTDKILDGKLLTVVLLLRTVQLESLFSPHLFIMFIHSRT